MPELKPDEQDTKYNPAQELYEREFGSATQKNDTANESGSIKKGTHVDAHGDTVQNNPNADIEKARDKEESGGSKGLYSGSSSRANGKQKKGKKKTSSLLGGKVATVAAVAGFGSVFAIIGILGSLFSSLLQNMSGIFHTDQDRSGRTNKIYANALASKKFTKGKCTGTITVLCKFQTMSDRQKRNMERAGFQVHGEKKPPLGRWHITGYTAPDGTRIDSARDLNRWANRNTANARAMNLATKGRAAFWLNQKMSNIFEKFGLRRGAILSDRRPGESDEEHRRRMQQDVDRNTNGSDGSGGSDEERRERARSRAGQAGEENVRTSVNDVNKRIGKAGWLAAGVVATCGIYNASNKITAYAKKYHIDQLVKYSQVFMNTADRIKDQGDIPPEAVEYAGSLMSESDPRKKITDEDNKESTNPDYGLSATDSNAYKIAAHGDRANLSKSAKKFQAGGYSEGKDWLSGIQRGTKAVEMIASQVNPSNIGDTFSNVGDQISMATSYITGGEAAAHEKMKQYLQNPSRARDGRQVLYLGCLAGQEAAFVAFIVGCALSAAAILAGGTGSIGVVGCLAAAGCAIGQAVGNDKCKDTTEWIEKKVLDYAKDQGWIEKITKLLQSGVIGSFTRYTDAGNAWGAGNAFFAESTAMGYGLRAATTKTEAREFIAQTEDDIKMDTRIAVEDAKKTPFDISNEHSFLGMVTRNANLYIDKQAPLYSTILSSINLLPRVLSYDKTAQADYYQPTQSQDERFSCEDPDLVNIGIKNADKFCNTTGVTPKAELDSARKASDNGDDQWIEDTVNYMANKQASTEASGGTVDSSMCDFSKLATFSLFDVASAVKEIPKLAANPSSIKDSENAPCIVKNILASMEPSIDKDGKPTKGSQYEKYIEYCTDKRKDPMGTFSTSIQEASSTRDLDWWTGEQCLKDSKMMVNFRTYFNLCTQQATADETKECYDDTPADSNEKTKTIGKESTGECANGGTKAIYTCALKYDNYQYVMGGGHGGNAQEWIKKFNNKEIPEWTAILDCSGLVRMAYVEAMGVEAAANVAPGGYNGDSAHWTKISLEQAEQGDIVTSSGHVAIVESNDKSAKKFKIFHASTDGVAREQQILHGEQSYGSTIAAYRAKK